MENNTRFTRVTAEQAGPNADDNIKIVWEIPYTDITGMDMCNALKTIMIGLTFYPEQINKIFADYLREYAADEFEITEKIEN